MGRAERHQDLTTYFKTVAKEFKGKMTFMWVDVDKEDNQGALSFFDMAKDGEKFTATMRIVNFGEDTAKFLPEVNTTDEQSLRDFANGVLDGKIEQHYKSAALPGDWDAKGVKVLVASNFHAVTGVESGKNVLVEMYAPWCGHCKQLEPIWDELGEKYKDHESIVIAKMDATANELEQVKVHSFPTIKYFPIGDGAEAVDFNGARTLEGFSKFLDAGGAAGNEPEAGGEEEELGEDEEEEVEPEPSPKDEL